MPTSISRARGTPILRTPGDGTATLSGTEGEVDDPDLRQAISRNALVEVKRLLSVRARAERTEAARLARVVAAMNARKTALEASLAEARNVPGRIGGLEERIKATADEATSSSSARQATRGQRRCLAGAVRQSHRQAKR